MVTDLSMPQMSGFEFAGALLAIRAATPIIMTSGYIRPGDQEKAQKIGLRGFITKPHTVDMIDQALDEVFQQEVRFRKPKAT